MLALGSRQNMTDLDTKRAIWVNAQLTRWFVSFAEFSCFLKVGNLTAMRI